MSELRCLTVDLRDVSFMDSTGVAFLVSLRRHMPAGTEIVVAHAAPIVHRVLELCGMDTVLDLAEAWDTPAGPPDRLDATG